MNLITQTLKKTFDDIIKILHEQDERITKLENKIKELEKHE